MFDKNKLKTTGLNRDEILQMVAEVDKELSEFTGDKTSTEYNNYVEKLNKIKQKLDAIDKIKDYIKGNSTKYPDIYKINLNKYADMELLEIASESFEFQSRHFYSRYYSCCGIGPLQNKLIDPSSLRSKEGLESLQKRALDKNFSIRITPESQETLDLRDNIKKNTKIEIYQEEEDIFKFEVKYKNDLHNNSTKMDDSVKFFIKINPHDKKINILVSQLFFRDDPMNRIPFFKQSFPSKSINIDYSNFLT
jgi:hypothetical protein